MDLYFNIYHTSESDLERHPENNKFTVLSYKTDYMDENS